MKVKEISDVAAGTAHHIENEHVRLKALLPIYQLGTQFLEADSEDELYERLLDVIGHEFDAYTVSIMMLQKEPGILEIVASRGLTQKQLDNSRIKPGERIAGWVFANNRPLIFNRNSQHRSDFASLLTRKEIASSICFPMVNRDGVIGVINISQTNDQVTYSDADIELVSILSQLTVIAIENVQLNRQKLETVRMETLLEQYVSSDVARLLINQKHDLREIGKVQELTVLFADLRNFTQLVQQLELQKLRLFLNEFFTLVTEEVYQSKGTLNKFIGDGVLVVFGAPVSHPCPGKAAVETAIQIGRRFKKMCERYRGENILFKKIALGIGVSSGEIFIGNVGSQQRFDYTVVGTAVNVAQRLATHAAGDTILITDAVRREIYPEIGVVNTEHVALKGFSESMQVHEVNHRILSME